MQILLIISILLILFISHDSKPKQHQQVVYPVFIGSNGYCIRDEIVNDLFSGLGKYFGTFFYDSTYNQTTNTVCYCFRVYQQLNPNFSRKRMLSLLRPIGEKALSRWFHEQTLYTNVDNFIAVTWQADRLCFHFAMNDAGFAEIADLRKLSH